MAKRHIIQAFLEQENTYLELLDNVPDFKELVDAGRISQEEFEAGMAEIAEAKKNYEFWAYVIMLMNKPNRKSKEDADMNKDWYNYLRSSSKEALLDESKDALAEFKKLIKEKKLNG